MAIQSTGALDWTRRRVRALMVGLRCKWRVVWGLATDVGS